MSVTYQDAYDHIINNIYAPVFFEKLARDYGLTPNTQDEARELLVLAGKLEQLEGEYVAKQANDRTNFIGQATQYLDNVLGRAPLPSGSPNAYNETEIKQAAANLSQVDHLRDAALIFADYMRQVNS
jgi:hypothetical protein